ncbi:IS3 family transposase [Falsihalocynthiibacter sp. S25ZX9]|uniref:IS3 family transposase n=1 Tax=Falsihalocynthiibacter sp. S25ZX9 TaxID=3240870 RepID=UPI003510A11D
MSISHAPCQSEPASTFGRSSFSFAENGRYPPFQTQECFHFREDLYGARKLWHSIRREGIDLARDTVERLMCDTGIESVRRGKKIKATLPDKALPCTMDLLNRQLRATVLNQFQSFNSFMQPFVQMPRSFCLPAMNVGGVDYKIH